MAEILTLSTPVTSPTITNYKLVALSFDIEAQSISMTAKSNTGSYLSRVINGAVAVTLMNQLNTANLSVKSLQRRVLEYMAMQGDFTGSVIGLPD